METKDQPSSLRCVTVETSAGFRHTFLLPSGATGPQLLQYIEAATGVPSRCSQAVLCGGSLHAKFIELAQGRSSLSDIPSYLNLCFPLRGGGEGDEEKPPPKKPHWAEEEEEDAESSSSTNSDSDANLGGLFITNGYQSGPHSGYQSGSSSSGYPDNFSSPSIETNSTSSEEETSLEIPSQIPSHSSLATEASSCESLDGSTVGGTSYKISSGETSSKTKFSNGMSDSGLSTLGTSDLEEEQNLPADPMKWSCEDVLLWLEMMTRRVGISEFDKHFFCMSGIGVAFIPRHGFVRRLGSKGLIFHQDFHHRMKAARCDNP